MEAAAVTAHADWTNVHAGAVICPVRQFRTHRRLRPMTSTSIFLATYPADTTPARRWEIWEAVAPLFERHGFHGVTIDELAAEAGLRTTELYRQFSSKQVLALFPLSRSNGIHRSWVARVAMLPRDSEVRRRAMLDFATEHAVAWRLALDLATEMIMTPPLDRYAGRLVKEAREDFGAIVGSVDPTMTPGQYVRLYKAFHQVVTPDASSRTDVSGHGAATAAVTTYWPLRS
jgi:AcrR family transcriptional regulator